MSKEQSRLTNNSLPVPKYLEETYNWAYLNPKNVPLLDRNLTVNLLLFGNAQRLIRAYLNEINAGQNMLQIAHVYGDLIIKIAEKIGSHGTLTLIDVAAIQLAQAQKKSSQHKNIALIQQDATQPYTGHYHSIGAFFLLHELPSEAKTKVINNMLAKVAKDNTKAVFIDYHRPNSINPVGLLLYWVNKCLEPYAHELWTQEIKDFANDASLFHWTKTTFFGGVYQKVVVTQKKT